MVALCKGGAAGSGAAGGMPVGSQLYGGLFDIELVDATTIDVTTISLPSGVANAAYWSVVPVGLGDPQVVTAVLEQSPGTVWRLTVDPGLTPGGYPYLVTFDFAAAGVVISPGCDSLSVTSEAVIAVSPAALPADQEPWDIANPHLIRDAGIVDPPPLGTYQINDRGDLALENRLQGVRKRIMRRIATMPGGFFHLPGYGLAQRLKGLTRPALVKALAAEAQSQVEREPEVTRAAVRVVQLRTAPNVLVVSVKARTILGLDVTANQAIDLRPRR